MDQFGDVWEPSITAIHGSTLGYMPSDKGYE